MRKTLQRRRGPIAFVVLVAVVVVGLVLIRNATTETGVTIYDTEAIETGTISVTVSGVGYAGLSEIIEVWPEGAGTVESIEATKGSTVETDQVLFTLDDTAWNVDDEVVAPETGMVWSVGVEEGDSVTAPGNADMSGQAGYAAPFVLVPIEPIAVRVDINEVDVPLLEVGQKATVDFDALPDLTITGFVSEIDDEGTITQGVVTFGVWIELDLQDERLKPGMSAGATIVIAVGRDELLVPNAAIKTNENGAEYVEVLDPDSDTPRTVYIETGLYNITHTVVESGLEAGDEVVIQTSTSTEASDGARSGGFLRIPGMSGGPH